MDHKKHLLKGIGNVAGCNPEPPQRAPHEIELRVVYGTKIELRKLSLIYYGQGHAHKTPAPAAKKSRQLRPGVATLRKNIWQIREIGSHLKNRSEPPKTRVDGAVIGWYFKEDD